nr:hypothetical protein [Tanacetum cinerariifolium]
MAEIKTDTTMEEFITNDQANYYLGITSITVNGNAAYELKEKFLDDLHDNAFSGTNGEDTVEHIEYFLKIIDLIDLPNGSSKGFLEKKVDNKEGITNKGFSNLEIYDWNEDVPWMHEKPWTNNEVWEEPTPVKHYCEPFSFKNENSECLTCSWKDDGYCNGGNLLGAYRVANILRYQDLEWYEALKDGKLKDEALIN